MKKTNPLAGLLGLGMLAATAASVYAFIVRPWMLRWGATDKEVASPFPGDKYIPNAKLCATNAVTIQAPPAQVWPWIVQIGEGRGGFYSYDWIENALGLEMDSTYQILEEYQQLKVGDKVPLAEEGFQMPVQVLEREKTLVLHLDTRTMNTVMSDWLDRGDFAHLTWSFYLDELEGGRTRLVQRFRANWNQTPKNWIFYRLFLEPGSFIMQRKMLLGIKERAELLALQETFPKSPVLETGA